MTDRDLLRHVLACQMLRDPKLAHEAVTGACEWDSGISFARLDELAEEAADQAEDLEDARSLGISISEHRVDRLYAAHKALVALSYAKATEDRACEARGARVTIGRSL